MTLKLSQILTKVMKLSVTKSVYSYDVVEFFLTSSYMFLIIKETELESIDLCHMFALPANQISLWNNKNKIECLNLEMNPLQLM